jgi:phage shock protein A
VLDDAVSGPRDDIQAELDRMGGGRSVDLELERMKAELGQGTPAPKQLDAASAPAPTVQPTAPTQADQPQAGEGA